MVTFVRNEVREHVPNIEREIAPRIGSGGRNRAAVITTQLQKTHHRAAAPVQRRYELPRANPAPIDRFRHLDSMLPAQRLYPHASRVMDVPGDHPDGPPRRARHDGRPQIRGQMLHEEDGDSIVRFPHWNESLSKTEERGHQEASPSDGSAI
jgi:hypothetical protein